MSIIHILCGEVVHMPDAHSDELPHDYPLEPTEVTASASARRSV